MVIKACQNCRYHTVKFDEGEAKSHCSNEDMYSIYTKCIVNIAIEDFIQREKLRNQEDRVSIRKGVRLLPISAQ